MQSVTLSITGMTCGHCVQSVRRALGAVPGVDVQNVRVGSAEVTLGAAATVDAIVAAVQDAGYEASLASGETDEGEQADGCACCAPAPASLRRAGHTHGH